MVAVCHQLGFQRFVSKAWIVSFYKVKSGTLIHLSFFDTIGRNGAFATPGDIYLGFKSWDETVEIVLCCSRDILVPRFTAENVVGKVVHIIFNCMTFWRTDSLVGISKTSSTHGRGMDIFVNVTDFWSIHIIPLLELQSELLSLNNNSFSQSFVSVPRHNAG